MEDKNKGLYGKFYVERTDGRSAPGQKHYCCRYFVLDITHDPHAIPALRAYAESAAADGYEALALDLLDIVRSMEPAREPGEEGKPVA